VKIQDEQKNISRLIPPDIQQSMAPAYLGASEACGAGSYMVMKSIMSGYTDKAKQTMFTKSANVLLTALKGLLEIVYKEIEKMHQQVVYDLTFLNQCYWEVPVSNVQAKQSIVPQIAAIEKQVAEAFNAFKTRKQVNVNSSIIPTSNTTTTTTTTTTSTSSSSKANGVVDLTDNVSDDDDDDDDEDEDEEDEDEHEERRHYFCKSSASDDDDDDEA